MLVNIKPGWVSIKHTTVNAEETKTFGEHAYLVALRCGGVMENPEFHHEFFQIIRADSPVEARKKYNELNHCTYYYGDVIGQIDDPYIPEEGEVLDTESRAMIEKPNSERYGVVLKRCFGVDGISKTDIDALLSKADNPKVFPIEIGSLLISALGFISVTASEQLDYSHKGLEEFIESRLKDIEKEMIQYPKGTEKEFPSYQYEYEGIKIWLSR